MLEDYTRVDKRAMRPLHKLLFDVVHKIILPRKHKRTEANYLNLTLMELLISQVQINLLQLILSHIHRISVHDDKDHGLGYGFWLGEVFEFFQVPVKEWQVQSTKDVFGGSGSCCYTCYL
uniref:Putative ovule protein n=1 Tax=Solanum chacoense TaxID=4108 RepID=A0A0V0HBE0_SOLCH